MNGQNITEHLIDKIERGLISADEANVEMVRMSRVRVVTNKLPRNVRSALNAAVKSGLLGHMKKDGRKPEVYFHPTFEYLARAERNRREREIISALARVSGVPGF